MIRDLYRESFDEMLEELGGMRVLDAVWFVGDRHSANVNDRDECVFARIDGRVYRISLDPYYCILAIDVAEPDIDDDVIAVAEMHRVGPHTVTIRGRCTCDVFDPRCVDGVYAIDESTDHVVLDVASVDDGEGGMHTMVRRYHRQGVSAPWLHGLLEIVLHPGHVAHSCARCGAAATRIARCGLCRKIHASCCGSAYAAAMACCLAPPW